MMQSLIFSALQDILTALVGVLVALLVAYVKRHFSAIQIQTASVIASEAVNFAAQATKKLDLTEDAEKYSAALGKAKELAAKAGLHFSDSQWETLLESALKKAKKELQPLLATAHPLAALSHLNPNTDSPKEVANNDEGCLP